VYRYAAGVAGTVAILMMVMAAWQWLFAVGDSSKINNAKNTISGALMGLALLFGGHLLLSSISERLVGLEVKNMEIVDEASSMARPRCSDYSEENCNSTNFCILKDSECIPPENSICPISKNIVNSFNEEFHCCHFYGDLIYPPNGEATYYRYEKWEYAYISSGYCHDICVSDWMYEQVVSDHTNSSKCDL